MNDHLKIIKSLRNAQESDSDESTYLHEAPRGFWGGLKPFLSRSVLLTALGVLAIALGVAWYADRETAAQADIFYAKAKDDMGLGRNDTAVRELDDAIERKSSPEYYYLKSYILANGLDKLYEAEINIDKALEMDAKNAFYLDYAGTLELNLDEKDKAISRYQQAIAAEPGNLEYRMHLANLYANDEDFEKAIPLYQEVLRRDSKYMSALTSLAAVYDNSNQPQKSRVIREKTVTFYPDYAAEWFWLGNNYEKLGEKPQAVAAYKKSIHYDPDSGKTSAQRILALTGEKVDPAYFKPDNEVIPVSFEGDAMYVQADIIVNKTAHPGKFLVDTGANTSVLYQHFVKQEHLEIPSDAPVAEFQLVGSTRINAPVFYVNLRMGQQDITNVRAAVVPDGKSFHFDGLIGLNALNGYTFEVDRDAGTLTLKR